MPHTRRMTRASTRATTRSLSATPVINSAAEPDKDSSDGLGDSRHKSGIAATDTGDDLHTPWVWSKDNLAYGSPERGLPKIPDYTNSGPISGLLTRSIQFMREDSAPEDESEFYPVGSDGGGMDNVDLEDGDLTDNPFDELETYPRPRRSQRISKGAKAVDIDDITTSSSGWIKCSMARRTSSARERQVRTVADAAPLCVGSGEYPKSNPSQQVTEAARAVDAGNVASTVISSVRYERPKRPQLVIEAKRTAKRPVSTLKGTVADDDSTTSGQGSRHTASSSLPSSPPSSRSSVTPRRTSGDHHGAYQWNPGRNFYLLLALTVLAVSWISSASVKSRQGASHGEAFHLAPEDGDHAQKSLYERFQRAITVLETSNERASQVMARLDRAMNAAEHVSQDATNAHQDAINARQALADATAELEKAKASWKESIKLDKNMLSEKETLHESFIQQLGKILPDKLVVTKSPDGEIKIADAFWVALKAKIEEDYGQPGPSGATVYGKRGKESQWQEFLARNDRLVEKKVDEAFKKKQKTVWAQAIEEEVILTRAQFLDALNKKYQEISSEVDDIKAYFGSQIRQLDSAISNRINDAIMERYNRVAREDVMKSITPSQLEAMAHVSILANAWSALTKINWLSPALGAVIDPNGTSISYDPNAAKGRSWRWFGFRNHALEIARFPAVNAPLVALLPWNELDDCWCTPMNDASSLDVHLGRRIYPSEITIEFVPASSTPDIDAAPRKFQIWGRIEGNKSAWMEMRRLFPHLINQPRNRRDTLKGWSPLGEFQYDIRNVNHVQTFALPFSAEAIGAAVGRIRLKMIDNWGNKDRVCLYRVRLHGKDFSTVATSEGSEDTR